MSAGGLSYSAITNYGKVTLPSVDTWGTNMNILRDPPKSIHTRRVDKVGQTSSITATIDDSSNRACEAILQYARGVNPMVSVSYSNQSNNGGKSTFGRSQGAESFLPYRVMTDGAFRPPVMRQEELLPLSRQPRVWTTAFTKPGFTDFSKKMKTCGTASETKEVHNSILNVAARPTAVFNIEKPIPEPFEVKYVIQKSNNVSGNSGTRTLDITSQNVQKPYNKILDNNMHVFANPNQNQNKYVNNSNKNTDPYLQQNLNVFANANLSDKNGYTNNNSKNTDPYLQQNLNVFANANLSDKNGYTNNTNLETERFLQNNINSNINIHSKSSTNRGVTPIDQVLDLSGIKTQHTNHTDYTSRKTGTDRNNYIHGDINLQRTIPEYNMITNKTQNIHKKQHYNNNIKLDRTTPITNAFSNKTHISVYAKRFIQLSKHRLKEEILAIYSSKERDYEIDGLILNSPDENYLSTKIYPVPFFARFVTLADKFNVKQCFERFF